MPHLIRDVAEEVWKNSLLSKVNRLETGEERSSSTEATGLFNKECPHSYHPDQTQPPHVLT